MNTQNIRRRTHLLSPYLINSEKVNAWQERAGISDEALARMMDCTNPTISRLVRNLNRSQKRQLQLAQLIETLSKGAITAADILINRFEHEGAMQ